MKTKKILCFLMVWAVILSFFAGCASNNLSEPSLSPAPAASAAENSNLSYEEGTSEADQIVNTTAAEKVILVVSFGTSFNESRSLTIGGIEAAVKEAYPDYQVRRAFTSQIIIDKLLERDNLKIDNVTQAMNRLVLDQVKEVIILPTTVMNGFEYDDLINEAMEFSENFESMKIAKWLFAEDRDYEEISQLLVDVTSEYRSPDTAIVYMGHGTEHEAGATYTKLQNVLNTKGCNDYVIGTVEHGVELDQVREILAGMNVKKVVLRPLMIVAGDHANNDMAGDEEDSWKTVLTEDGYQVETILEGLGQIKGIQEIFIRHIKDAMDTDNLSAKAPAAKAVGVFADRIKNGVYPINVDTDSAMFKIIDCELRVEDNKMTAAITMSGKGFGKIYMGSAEEALKDTANHHEAVLVNEKNTFVIPVAALDADIDCAGFGTKSGNWYDHIVVFESGNIPHEAFLPREINAELTGGTGRASIQSPAALTYKDGTNHAKIIWSSQNYIYMIVNGKEYLPVNTQGNSTFVIPVNLDRDMKVIACTTAMSEPKEIEYTLRFDSMSIK